MNTSTHPLMIKIKDTKFKVNIQSYLRNRNINCIFDNKNKTVTLNRINLIQSDYPIDNNSSRFNKLETFNYEKVNDYIKLNDMVKRHDRDYLSLNWLYQFKRKDGTGLSEQFIKNIEEVLFQENNRKLFNWTSQVTKHPYLDLTIFKPTKNIDIYLYNNDIKIVKYYSGKIKHQEDNCFIDLIISFENENVNVVFKPNIKKDKIIEFLLDERESPSLTHVHPCYTSFTLSSKTGKMNKPETSLIKLVHSKIIEECSIYLLSKQGMEDLIGISDINDYIPELHDGLLQIHFYS